MAAMKHWSVDGDWIVLASGGTMCFRDDLAVLSRQVELRDIAHALGNICRFNGHSKSFYSVAQHSCVCALLATYLVPDNVDPQSGLKNREGLIELARWMLLHDGHEAYVGDRSSPLKAWLKRMAPGMVDYYAVLSETLDNAIASRFGVLRSTHPDWCRAVKMVDLYVLGLERRDVVGEEWEWPQLAGLDLAKLDGVNVAPVSPVDARNAFNDVYDALFGSARGVIDEDRLGYLLSRCGLTVDVEWLISAQRAALGGAA